MKQLTEHFTLDELLESQSATRKGFTEQFSPSMDVVENLDELCEHILEPLRKAIGYPIFISSGYRCERLNKSIGGAKNSQHLEGKAVDIVDRKNGNQFIFDKIKELGLPFDQMIDEFGMAWVHVSYDKEKQRKQILLARKDDKGKTVYIKG
jgi:hypothetical protein